MKINWQSHRQKQSRHRIGHITLKQTRALIMKVKSVMAGEYTAPPAQGPMISEICGTTPDASTLRCAVNTACHKECYNDSN